VTRRAINPAEHSAELRKEVMAALHRGANLAHTRLRVAAFGRVQPKACAPRSLLPGAMAVGPSGRRPRQIARIKAPDASLCRRRVDHQGVQHLFGVTAIVGLGSGHDDSQRLGTSSTG